jgi:hypothetical protein
MSPTDPMTSVPVHASTLRLMQEFKTGAQNWDNFLLNLMEKEMDRDDVEHARKILADFKSGKVPSVPFSEVRKELHRRRRQ